MFDEKNECLQDVANTIRYELSYSNDKEELFERLFKRGILSNIPSNENKVVFKTLWNTFTNEFIVKKLHDDFFEFENLRNNLGYNLKGIKTKEKETYFNELEREREIS